jgi:hypothetical protein
MQTAHLREQMGRFACAGGKAAVALKLITAA